MGQVNRIFSSGPGTIALSSVFSQFGLIAAVLVAGAAFGQSVANELSIFLSLQLFFSSFGTSRLELAFSSKNVQLHSVIMILSLISVVLALIVTFLGFWIARNFFEIQVLQQATYWLFALIPAHAIFLLLRARFIVLGAFVNLLILSIAFPLSGILLMVICGFAGCLDPVFAYGLGCAAAVFVWLSLVFPRMSRRALSSSRSRWIRLLACFSSYPKNVLGTGFLNSAVTTLLPVIITATSGPESAGYIFLAQRFCGFPTSLYSMSVWQHCHFRFMSGRNLEADVAYMYRAKAKLFWFWVLFLVAYPIIGLSLKGFDLTQELIQPGFLSAILLIAMIRSLSNITSYFVAFRMQGYEVLANIFLSSVAVIGLLGGHWLFSETYALYAYGMGVGCVYTVICLLWAQYFKKMRYDARYLSVVWLLWIVDSYLYYQFW